MRLWLLAPPPTRIRRRGAGSWPPLSSCSPGTAGANCSSRMWRPRRRCRAPRCTGTSAPKMDCSRPSAIYEQDNFDAGIAAAVAGLSGPDRLDAALRFIVEFQSSYSLGSMADIEPEHVLQQMKRVLPIIHERIARIIPGDDSDVAAAAVVRIAVCHYLIGGGTPEQFLAELRHAAGLGPSRRAADPGGQRLAKVSGSGRATVELYYIWHIKRKAKFLYICWAICKSVFHGWHHARPTRPRRHPCAAAEVVRAQIRRRGGRLGAERGQSGGRMVERKPGVLRRGRRRDERVRHPDSSHRAAASFASTTWAPRP